MKTEFLPLGIKAIRVRDLPQWDRDIFDMWMIHQFGGLFTYRIANPSPSPLYRRMKPWNAPHQRLADTL